MKLGVHQDTHQATLLTHLCFCVPFYVLSLCLQRTWNSNELPKEETDATSEMSFHFIVKGKYGKNRTQVNSTWERDRQHGSV